MKRSALAPRHRPTSVVLADVGSDPIPLATPPLTARGRSWLHRRPALERRGVVLKYTADRVVAAVCLVVALPIMLVIGIVVRVSSRGPVLYRDPRLGHRGRPFLMLKFRTMTGRPETDGEADGQWIASQIGRPVLVAPRVVDRTTSVGRVLRRMSLDELPQLFNVLRGDMSLVGPRPERVAVARLFMEGLEGYVERHRMKPGITGWAQVRGLRGETSLRERVDSDNFYIDNWSVWLDLKVLLLTVPAMIRGNDASR